MALRHRTECARALRTRIRAFTVSPALTGRIVSARYTTEVRGTKRAETFDRLDVVSKLDDHIRVILTEHAAREFQLDRVGRIATESLAVIEDRRLVDEHVLDTVGIHEVALHESWKIIRYPSHGAHVDLGHRVMIVRGENASRWNRCLP